MLWSELAISQFHLWQHLALTICNPGKGGLSNSHPISRLAHSLQVLNYNLVHFANTLSDIFVHTGGVQHIPYRNGISCKQEKSFVAVTTGNDLH